jgi:hypothetical protein
MRRMYVEQQCPTTETVRQSCARLMAQLDNQAATQGHRVTGEVTIMEYDSPLVTTRHLRLEADVKPA